MRRDLRPGQSTVDVEQRVARFLESRGLRGYFKGYRNYPALVTASVDELHFLNPVKQGEVVVLRASVNRVFRTSLEVGVNVTTENTLTGDSKHTNTAYLTFVAIDDDGRPVAAAPVRPVTAVEKRRYRDAARRREIRLLHRRRGA